MYCQLLSDTFSIEVQILLILVVLVILVVKRFHEKPRRTWKIWFLDISKQAVSGSAAHIIAMIVSICLGKLTDVKYQCGWYFITFTFDTTLGVFISYKLLKLSEKMAYKKDWPSLKKSGHYIFNDEVNYTIWIKQLSAWTVIVIFSKILCGSILIACNFFLKHLASGLCSLFDGHPKEMLIFVMILGPGVMNLIQAWIQDNFLKKKEKKTRALISSSLLESDLTIHL